MVKNMKRLRCIILGHKWTEYIESPCGNYYVSTCRNCEKRKYKMPTINGYLYYDE